MTPAQRNAKYLIGQEDKLAASVRRELAALRRELEALVQQMPLDAVSVGRQMRRYDALVAKADDLIKSAYTSLNGAVRTELVALGQQQGARAADQLKRLTSLDTVQLALPTRAQVRSILTTDPVQGQVMGKWWKEQARTTQRAFRTQMRMGMLRQESVGDLVKRIRGTRGPDGAMVGGLMTTSARAAEALARTSVNEVANKAALATYSQDPSISEEYEFSAVLDDRTTEECQEADGKVFRYDDPGKLLPPLHWNCRSTILPIIKADVRASDVDKASDAATVSDGMVRANEMDVRPHVDELFNELARKENHPTPFRSPLEDNFQKVLLREQGFSGLPRVASSAEVDALVADGNEGFWRGLMPSGKKRPAALIEQFRTGEHFAGRGVYGNGTYSAAFMKAERKAANAAAEYAAGDNAMMRGVMRPGARIGKLKDISKLARRAEAATDKAIEKLATKMPGRLMDAVEAISEPYLRGGGGKWAPKIIAQYPEYRTEVAEFRRLLVERAIAADPGRYAVKLGYDAYYVGDGTNYMVILNRTATVIDKTTY